MKPLRQTLLSGGRLPAAFLFLDQPDVAEIIALAGFPLLIVDREHACADMAGALHMLRAIRSTSAAFVMARARDGSPAAIKPLLDAGFDGLMVPDVRSAVEARAIAEAARYAPVGRRGAQFTVSRAALYGTDAGHAEGGHAERANESLLLAVMIESRAGLEAIDEIAATPGIDMLFLGPLDLTTDYGSFGDLGSPELALALRDAESRILDSGKLLGGAALPDTSANTLFKRGYTLVSAVSDVGLIRDAAACAVHRVQP
ncbi:HpcH/HpaI aldolase family protein [Roseicitreum antarcticum]|uniref:2-keto-3-deoxy-L-rhamnonate aldolase RhmA n=1 Tax=Roseicitreum antarcticum TaxID=564137 RepID=A0A1H2Z765_9RHOB|nr:aldolase/citrate lyase family protein [Roseicitreum antarcticum]SDX12639.1 2-keto-3-deoxy-L-rhamnonate aldolase RhmA [Roseicitreum antarcticum]